MHKEFEEIGELLFKVIDYIKADNRKKSEIQKVEDSHYLERLMRKTSPGTKVYWELIEKIKSHPMINRKASDYTIGAELRSILGLTDYRKNIRKLYPGEAGQRIIDNLVKQRSPYLVVFPLKGLFPGANGLTIGNITFDIYQKILENYKIPKFQPPKPGEKHFPDKKNIFNNISNEEKSYLNAICVGTKVYACDIRAASFLAMEKINLSLNIIRLLIPLDYGLLKRPRISIDEIIGVSKAFVISVEDGDRYFPVSDGLESLSAIYSLFGYKYKTDKSIEKANQIACKDSDDRTELEKRVISSINWIGDGIHTTEKDIKVVKCVIGLEVLFKIPVGGKQRRFIKNVAKLFEPHVKNSDFIRKHAKKIYKLRSAVVHGGKRVITDEQAELTERFASGYLLKVLEIVDNFSSEKDFDIWLNSEG